MDSKIASLREDLIRIGKTSARLLCAVASALLCGCAHEQMPDLHAADVPVHALIHHTADPTVAFPESFPLQVAVYWAKPDDDILGAVHSLREMGIPFFVTRDLDSALRHQLVIVYPTVDANTFTLDQVHELVRYVDQGGSIFAVNVFAGALKDIFGFREFQPSRRRYRVDFEQGSDPILRYINRPEELEVRLGDPKYGDVIWTNGYTDDATAKVLARFEDGSAALLRKTVGRGSAYLLGASLKDVVLRSQDNRDYDAERHYANAFEPGADVWMLLLRAWYESNAPRPVRLATIPGGQSSVLLLSHDVDWENSFDPGLDFARMEKEHHALSTFFIQTKYVSDYNSKSFFFGKDLDDLKQLFSQGFSIGSHSIIHSRGFNKFELGSGTETYATYRPAGTGFDTAKRATVFGEVRVSKELLNGELSGQQTIFFRAGHLRVPASLPEALQRTGYEFDSSFTADDVLTNFPYALPLGLGFDEDSGLYEFPVTFEDEEKPPLPQRIASMLDVIRANAENGAINVLLIHPNVAGEKLAAEKDLLEHLPKNVTATDMQSFALFWRARDLLQWSVKPGKSDWDAELLIATQESASGITFEFGRELLAVDGGAKVLPDRRRIVLPDLKAGEQIAFRVHYVR
jgi:hypothetical protein